MVGGAYREENWVVIPHNCGASGRIKMSVEQYERHFFLAILESQEDKYVKHSINRIV